MSDASHNRLKKKNKRKANSSSKLGLRGGGMGGAKRKKKGKSDSETSVSDSRRSGSSGCEGSELDPLSGSYPPSTQQPIETAPGQTSHAGCSSAV